MAWYQDILTKSTSKVSRASPGKAPATPFGKLQLTTPLKTTRATAAATAAAAAASGVNVNDEQSPEVPPGGGVSSPLAKLGLDTPNAKAQQLLSKDAAQVCLWYQQSSCNAR